MWAGHARGYNLDLVKGECECTNIPTCKACLKNMKNTIFSARAGKRTEVETDRKSILLYIIESHFWR